MNNQAIRPTLTAVERSPIQRALDNYTEMEQLLVAANDKNRLLSIQNTALLNEIGMLREAVERSDRDRMRLQAVASTFGGQARALAAIFNDIMALAIKQGIEAADGPKTEASPTDDLKQAGDEAQAIIQRIVQREATREPSSGEASPRAPQAVVVATVPAPVDWARLPQG